MADQIELFACSKPCRNCPYKTNSPVRYWHRDEFQKVLDAENSDLGAVFLCHKKNGGICIGFLMDQDRRAFPSLMLRMELILKDIGRDYLDKLRSPAPLYKSIREMIRANFPDLLK